MTTTEIAAQLVARCREGRFLDAVKTLYADDIVSVEAVDYQGLGHRRAVAHRRRCGRRDFAHGAGNIARMIHLPASVPSSA